MSRCTVLLALLLLFSSRLVAQEQDSTSVKLVLVDGEELVGTILEDAGDKLLFLTRSGIEMTLQRSQVREILSLESERFYRLDPNSSRLLFAPTGRSLRKKEGYLAVYELLFPFVAYSPGFGITLSGGVSLIPGAGGQVVYAAPKVTLYETTKTAVALGVLGAGYVGKEDAFSPVGLLYGVVTRGGRERSLTLGVAFGWSDESFSSNPAIMLGGHAQVSNTLALVTENYIITSEKDLVGFMAGVRFFGKQLSVDLALATLLAAFNDSDAEDFPFLPWVGFVYNFGPK